MTKAEIIEAINSTIVANGQKGITAESLANLLIEIVNATPEPEEEEDNGKGQVIFYLGAPSEEIGGFVLTEEQMAHNAKMFEVVKNAEPCVLASVDVSNYYKALLPMSIPNLKYSIVSAMTGYTTGGVVESEEGTTNIPECVMLSMEMGELAVLVDGSVLHQEAMG